MARRARDSKEADRSYLDPMENPFLACRNGMHRYNNQDHSLLTAMTDVDIIVSGQSEKTIVWEVNAD